MMLSHVAPSCLDMSPYRPIWIHFTEKSMILIQEYLVLGRGPGHGPSARASERVGRAGSGADRSAGRVGWAGGSNGRARWAGRGVKSSDLLNAYAKAAKRKQREFVSDGAALYLSFCYALFSFLALQVQ